MRDKEIRNNVPGIDAIDKTNKNTRHIYYFFLSYIAIAITSFYLNLGDNHTLSKFTKYVGSIIPSINGTADIADNINYARLMLVIAWCYNIPFLMFLLNCTNMKKLKSHKVKNIEMVMLASTLLLVGFLWMAFNSIPDNTGLYTKLIYNIVKFFNFGVCLWGLIIWIVPSVTLYCVILCIIMRFKSN